MQKKNKNKGKNGKLIAEKYNLLDLNCSQDLGLDTKNYNIKL